MESTLRCNSLDCRKDINTRAAVTTCSHIFCLDCCNRFQLNVYDQQRTCPACQMQLANPDDAVVTNLHPTEDYKTSVLSGLSPNVIMECAGRALSFWAYQTTQEIVYQEFVVKKLTTKFANLNTQMQQVQHQSNAQIQTLHDKMIGMAEDQANLEGKHKELVSAYQEKSRRMLQTQELYDKLKRRAMLGQVQDAASNVVDSIQQNPSRFTDTSGTQRQSRLFSSNFLDTQRSSIHNTSMQNSGGNVGSENMNMPPPSARRVTPQPDWAGFSSQGSSNDNHPIETPSTHRQRLAPNFAGHPPRMGLTNLKPNFQQGIAPSRGNSAGRSPSAGNAGFAGYGLSAGLKVSNMTPSLQHGTARSLQNSRVAHLPTPNAGGFPSSRNSTLNGRPVETPASDQYLNGNTFYR